MCRFIIYKLSECIDISFLCISVISRPQDLELTPYYTQKGCQIVWYKCQRFDDLYCTYINNIYEILFQIYENLLVDLKKLIN